MILKTISIFPLSWCLLIVVCPCVPRPLAFLVINYTIHKNIAHDAHLLCGVSTWCLSTMTMMTSYESFASIRLEGPGSEIEIEIKDQECPSANMDALDGSG